MTFYRALRYTYCASPKVAVKISSVVRKAASNGEKSPETKRTTKPRKKAVRDEPVQKKKVSAKAGDRKVGVQAAKPTTVDANGLHMPATDPLKRFEIQPKLSLKIDGQTYVVLFFKYKQDRRKNDVDIFDDDEPTDLVAKKMIQFQLDAAGKIESFRPANDSSKDYSPQCTATHTLEKVTTALRQAKTENEILVDVLRADVDQAIALKLVEGAIIRDFLSIHGGIKHNNFANKRSQIRIEPGEEPLFKITIPYLHRAIEYELKPEELLKLLDNKVPNLLQDFFHQGYEPPQIKKILLKAVSIPD